MTATTITHSHAPQQHTDKQSERMAAIDATFALGGSTWGWTELETVDQVTRVHNRPGVDTYWPRRNADGSPEIVTVASGKRRPAAANAVTVSWRTDVWEFVKGRSRQIHGGRANVSPSRFITEVWLRNLATGVVVRFVQSHWISGVQPVFKSPEDYREASYWAAVKLMRKVLAEGTTPTIVSLDSNTTRLPELVKVPGLKWERTGGTHGPRQIDWVGHIGVDPVQITRKSISRRVLKFLDHKATVAHFALVTDDDHQEPPMTGIYLEDHTPRVRQFKPRTAKVSGVIVVHTAEGVMDTVGPDTGAEGVAAFIANRTTFGSYHRLCDSDSTVPLVRLSQQAYGDGTGSNPHAIHISFACKTTDWVRMSAARREGFLRNGARAAAEAIRYVKSETGRDVPLKRITRSASEARNPGFISHGDRDPGRRSDPGAQFPWAEFFNYIAEEIGGRDWFDMATENDLKQAIKEVLTEMTFETPGAGDRTVPRNLGQIFDKLMDTDKSHGERLRKIESQTKGA